MKNDTGGKILLGILNVGLLVLFIGALQLDSNSIKYLLVTILLLVFILVNLLFVLMSIKYQQSIKRISYDVSDNAAYIFNDLPIGLMRLNDAGIVKWCNNHMLTIFEAKIEFAHIDELVENFTDLFNDDVAIINVDEKYYRVIKRNQFYYWFDISTQEKTNQLYQNQKLVVGFVNLDNYEDFRDRLDIQVINELVFEADRNISEWCKKYNVYLRKYMSNKYIMIANDQSLRSMIEDNFSILDTIREHGNVIDVPITISMSFIRGIDDPIKAGESAQAALNIALSRGGDQVIITDDRGENKFYGGKSEAVEKRNRVRARMLSKSIASTISSSSNVIIMGHHFPDLDSIGAVIGTRLLALEYNLNVYCVINEEELNKSSRQLYELVTKDNKDIYTTEEKALSVMDNRSLLIVVDTNVPSLVASKAVLEKAKNCIVIDHHRRGNEIIDNALISYVEPYASSTCELVSELINYQEKSINVTSASATAMLAGIVLDTKHFIYRTGARTFDAASNLRNQGADLSVVNEMLKDSVDELVLKNQIINTLEMFDDCAIVLYDSVIEPYLLASSADDLMEIAGVNASFAIGRFNDSTYYISARSNGGVNVQVIMEALGGGGHLSNAATKVLIKDYADIKQTLKSKIRGEIDESNIS